MILAIGAVKGGVGKSLITTNLAVLRSSLGKKVLLVDADEQTTTISWADQRTALGVPTVWTTVQLKSAAVRTEVRKMIVILPTTIGLRKAFSNATAEGLGIIETKADKKAVGEIMALHDVLFSRKSIGAKKDTQEKKTPVRQTRSVTLTQTLLCTDASRKDTQSTVKLCRARRKQIWQ